MPIRVHGKRQRAQAAPPSPSGQGFQFALAPPPPGHLQRPPGISLCMIVKNEERFLGQCLKSIADVVDEIIVVDTGSTDRTIEIAKSFGATVIERPWRNDFAWARNESIKPATKRWIMFLDADEELTEESKPVLRALKTAPAYRDAIWVRCYNESDDYRGTGAMSHALIRIFPNSPEIRFRGMIHEFPSWNNSPTGLTGTVAPVSIIHHGYLKDIVASRNKAARNLEIVKAAAEAEPEDPFHWFNLGSTAFLMWDFDQAVKALEEMRRLNGTQLRGFIPNGLSLLAEVYCDKLGDMKKGEEAARLCLSIAPRYANAHFQLGKTLVAQRRFDEAREAYQAAIDDGKYAHLQFVIDDQVYIWKAHSEMGSSYVIEGRDADAVEWFRKGLQNAPAVEPLQVNLARALERLQRTDEAESAYRQAYQDHPESDLSVIEYVNFLLRQGRGIDALQIIDASHERLSDDKAAMLLVAANQIAVKHKLLSALDYLEKAAERAPHSAEILNALEGVYRSRGDDASITRLLQREATTDPRAPGDFLRRSHQALAARDFALALKYCESGLAVDENDVRLRYNAALALANTGEKSKALAHLTHVDEGDAEVYAAAMLLRAATERELGKPDEAMASLERLLAVSPDHAEALGMRAALLEGRGDAAGAENTLRRLFESHRQRGGVELAAFYLRHQRFDEARAVADAALTAS